MDVLSVLHELKRIRGLHSNIYSQVHPDYLRMLRFNMLQQLNLILGGEGITDFVKEWVHRAYMAVDDPVVIQNILQSFSDGLIAAAGECLEDKQSLSTCQGDKAVLM